MQSYSCCVKQLTVTPRQPGSGQQLEEYNLVMGCYNAQVRMSSTSSRRSSPTNRCEITPCFSCAIFLLFPKTDIIRQDRLRTYTPSRKVAHKTLAVLGFPQEILGDSTKAGGIELLTNLATSVGINGTAFAAGNDTALAYFIRPT